MCITFAFCSKENPTETWKILRSLLPEWTLPPEPTKEPTAEQLAEMALLEGVSEQLSQVDHRLSTTDQHECSIVLCCADFICGLKKSPSRCTVLIRDKKQRRMPHGS